jgi:Na+/H+ antiporter NhaD/arsenite permease-like protein
MKSVLKKSISLILLSFLVSALSYSGGLDQRQAVILFIFGLSIFGSLFFWKNKLSFAFIGSGIFLIIKAVSLEEFVKFAALDVILFLVGMMIIVGMMKESGLFKWLINVLLRVRNLTGTKLFVIVMVLSAFFSALMGEVASIIVMVTILFEICSMLGIAAAPFILCSVLTTNIGSAATVLGNPVGVLIAARSGLSFEDFIAHALPVSVVALVVTVVLLIWWYRKYLKELSTKLKSYLATHSKAIKEKSLVPDTQTAVSILIFLTTIIFISLHKRFETALGLGENTLLMIFPIIAAGVVMLYRHDRAAHYVEKEVEWNSLLFFLFLFGQAGVIHASGIGNFLAQKVVGFAGDRMGLLSGIVLFASGGLSSVLDNVVTVASFVPLLKGLETIEGNVGLLWWALLFGACFGGNITMIGSTANIVALGLLEKKEGKGISFAEWFKVGFVVGILTMAIALVFLLVVR